MVNTICNSWSAVYYFTRELRLKSHFPGISCFRTRSPPLPFPCLSSHKQQTLEGRGIIHLRPSERRSYPKHSETPQGPEVLANSRHAEKAILHRPHLPRSRSFSLHVCLREESYVRALSHNQGVPFHVDAWVSSRCVVLRSGNQAVRVSKGSVHC